MRLLTLLVLSLSLASPASAEVQLRFKFTPGEVIRQKMTQVMNMTMMAQGREIKSSVNQTMNMEQSVDAVDADGNAQVRQKITRVQMSMQAPAGQAFQFDSADENSQAVPAAVSMLKQLAGAEFRAQVAPTGQMTDIVVPEQLEQAIKKVPGSPFGEGTESLKQMIGQSTTVFPEKSLNKGDTWTDDKSMTMPLGELKVHQVNTYEGANEDGLHVINVALEMELVPGKNPQFAIAMKDSDAQGKMLFDSEKGALVRTDLTQNMTMQITVGGQTMEQKIQQTVTLEQEDAPQEKPE